MLQPSIWPVVLETASKSEAVQLASETLLPCHFQAWGYPNIKAYYDDINGLKWIPKIKTPTLFLSAEDDPFLGYADVTLQL